MKKSGNPVTKGVVAGYIRKQERRGKDVSA